MDKNLIFSTHAKSMMHERMIQEEWVLNTVLFPDRVEERKDDEVHYLKVIPDAKGKVLRVIINPILSPNRVITIFFDRRERP
ncbi:hypothetical protein J2T58_002252 [Methanocalculus alkaliphilus]|uniref:DUF4258 domain-containing protein n=1 Tax=Methanocalculus alkaliphilus TaxID=768730 RepID=UPI00209D7619|nr:DUF4258 domain-containing protein [Methanocalculus alkaliphilus]MCP1716375.1 hypothetical protein [Methanocalculus alkaliphilus]